MCLRARGWCPHGACVHGDDVATTACARACVLGRWKGRGLTRRGALLRSRCQPERHRGVVQGFSEERSTSQPPVTPREKMFSFLPLSDRSLLCARARECMRGGGRAKRTLLVCGLRQQAASGAAGLWQDLPAEATQACVKIDWRNSQTSSPPRSGFSVRDYARGYTAIPADMCVCVLCVCFITFRANLFGPGHPASRGGFLGKCRVELLCIY
jgi:hypothetical protein